MGKAVLLTLYFTTLADNTPICFGNRLFLRALGPALVLLTIGDPRLPECKGEEAAGTCLAVWRETMVAED